MKRVTLILISLLSFIYGQTPGTLKWVVDLDYEVTTCPAINGAGDIILMNQDSVCCISADGKIKWQKSHWGHLGYAPVIDKYDNIYCLNKGVYRSPGGIFRYNGSGNFEKSLDALGGWNYYPMTINALNEPIASYDDWEAEKYYIGIIDTTDNLKWRIGSGSKWYKGFVVAYFDGSIIIGSSSMTSCFSSEGILKWKISKPCQYSPSIGNDGTIYIVSGNDINAINPVGTIKWSISLYNGVYQHAPVIGVDGTIYIGTNKNNKIHAYNPGDGSLKWMRHTRGVIKTPSVVGDDGNIYVASEDSSIYSINGLGQVNWEYNTEGKIYNPTIDNNGILYFTTSEKKLFALHTGCTGLAKSSWPKISKDMKNRSSVHNPNCAIAKIVTSDSVLCLGDTLILDGTSSISTNSENLSYLWRVTDAANNNRLDLQDSTSGKIKIVFPDSLAAGDYSFSLTVHDTSDAENFGYSSDIVTIEIQSSYSKWKQTLSVASNAPVLLPDGNVAVSNYKNLYIFSFDGTVLLDKTYYGHYSQIVPITTNSLLSLMFYHNGYLYNQSQKAEEGFYTYYFFQHDIENLNSHQIYKGGRKLLFNAVLNNDKCIACSYDSLFCFNLDWSIDWCQKLDANIVNHISIGKNNQILFTCSNKKLYCLAENGNENWEMDIGQTVTSSIAIGKNGESYFGTEKGLISVGFDGSKLWQYNTSKSAGNPVIGRDEVIFFMSENGVFHAVSSSGNELWNLQFDVSNNTIGVATIGSSGTIYIGSGDTYFYAINTDGEILWQQYIGANASAPAIDDNGNIYFSSGKIFYALKSDETGLLKSSSWPRMGANNFLTYTFPDSITSNVVSEIAGKFSLSNLYPNPFNPVINIKYKLPTQSDIAIKMYDINGKLVDEISEKNKQAGIYNYQWKASHLPSGIYFIKMEAGNTSQIRKCTLLK